MKRGILSSSAMRCVVGLLAFAVPICAAAQKTEADIKARLVNKPLYQRGQWVKDDLSFGATGHLRVTVAPVTFTLAGIDIRTVQLTDKELVLGGQRIGLEFDHCVPKRVGLGKPKAWGRLDPEKMTIRIETPADGDFTAALDAIFTDKLADFVPQLPAYWQKFGQEHLLGTAESTVAARDPSPVAKEQSAATVRPIRIVSPVSSPVLVSMGEPAISYAARELGYSGVVLVNLIVDAAGKPEDVHIQAPLGLGLDENAIAAVSQYRFKPAMKNGSPIAVELHVEVNFTGY